MTTDTTNTTDTTDTNTTTDAEASNSSTASTGLSTADLAGTTGQQPAENDTQVETRPSGGDTSLFDDGDAQGFRERWTSVQVSFVDDPQAAVQEADSLVADTIKRLAQIFADERSQLESQWSSGQDVSTEDLRLALQRYRSFFDRLLTV